MPDDLDIMLQGSDQTSASQAQNGDQGDETTQGNPVEKKQTPEEIAGNSRTQDRIKKLVQEKRELATRLENLERLTGQGQQTVPPAPGSQFKPDVELAVRRLSEVGMATKEDVGRELDDRLNRLRWEQEQQRLETRYTGINDEPQYVREEVEDFISSHPQYRTYAAEDVFRFKMFPDEFTNLELSKRGTKTGKSQTLKPTNRAVSQEQGLTPEYIADRTDIKKYPDAVKWQEDHRQEIDKVLSQMSSE